jgi:hypothetical protein
VGGMIGGVGGGWRLGGLMVELGVEGVSSLGRWVGVVSTARADLVATPTPPPKPRPSLPRSPDGKLLVTACDDLTLRVFDVHDPRQKDPKFRWWGGQVPDWCMVVGVVVVVGSGACVWSFVVLVAAAGVHPAANCCFWSSMGVD